MGFTHLDKFYWRKEKITKEDLLNYYAAISRFILPYLKNRPLVLRRFPDGIEGIDFFQKDCGPNPPSFIKTFPIQHEHRTIRYFVIQNVKSLLYIVNLGSIELHPFHARFQQLTKPDYMILDLDPEDVPFDTVIDVAIGIHSILQKMHIQNLCKTSGGRGLHIYIPLHGKYSYKEVAHYAKMLAQICHLAMPESTSLERLPRKRQKKVYIDYLQNSPMKSVVAPYSARGKKGAPISTPLLWEEVRHGLSPEQFTLKTVPKRLAQKGDLFKSVLAKRSNLKVLLKQMLIKE